MYAQINLTQNAINLAQFRTGEAVLSVRIVQWSHSTWQVVALLSNGKKWSRLVKLVDLLRACPNENGYYVRVQGVLCRVYQIGDRWYHSYAPKHFSFDSPWECLVHLAGAIARRDYGAA